MDRNFTLTDLLTLIAFVFLLGMVIWFGVKGGISVVPPKNWRYDPVTNTTTWEDESGRKFLKSSDGSVRELSRTGR